MRAKLNLTERKATIETQAPCQTEDSSGDITYIATEKGLYASDLIRKKLYVLE